jgi:hypothetical protein
MDDKRVKVGVFLGLTFLASVFLGKAVGLFFAYNFFEFLRNFFDFLVSTVFGLVLVSLTFCLPALFLTTQRLLFLAILVNSLGFLFGFCLMSGLPNMGSGFFLAVLYFGCQRFFFKGAQGQAKKFVSFFPLDIFIPKVSTLLFYLTLVFSLSFHFALKKEVDRGKFVIPERLFEQVMGPASQIFQKSLEESLRREIGEKFGEEIEEELGTQDPEEILKFLQEEVKETAEEGELRQELGFRPELFEIKSLNPVELRAKIQELIEPFLKYLPFLAALSLFFTLRIVVGFLMIFLPWLISAMFRILLRTGILRIVEKQETVKKISL